MTFVSGRSRCMAKSKTSGEWNARAMGHTEKRAGRNTYGRRLFTRRTIAAYFASRTFGCEISRGMNTSFRMQIRN